jgi:hypothetical protein
MSKQIRVDRERARDGGWTDEQIDAYEASVNGRADQYDAMQPGAESMQKPHNPEAPWIDRSAENSALIDAGLVNVGLDVASKAGIGAGVGLGGYGLYRAGKGMFGGGQPGAAPRVAPTMAPETAPASAPATAPAPAPSYAQPNSTGTPRVSFSPIAPAASQPAVEPIRVPAGSPWAGGASAQPNFTPPGTPTPQGRLPDFVRQTGPYAPPQDSFSRTMAEADRVLRQGQPLPQAAPQTAAPAAGAAATPFLQKAITAAAPYARAATGLGMALYPSTANAGEQQQLNKMYPERAQQAQTAQSAITAAGRQPRNQADLDQMIREAAARRALTGQ